MSDGMLLTVTEAAKKVGRSRGWFYTHALNEVESKWVGNQRFIVAASLERWINGQDDAA